MSFSIVTDIDDENRLPASAVDSADLILFLDQLFDSLNSINRLAPRGKPLKGGVRKDSPHVVFWNECIQEISKMIFFLLKKTA